MPAPFVPPRGTTPLPRRTALAALAALVATASGCGPVNALFRGRDNRTPPAPLTDLPDPAVAATVLWQRDAGSGIGDEYLILTPAVGGGDLFVAGHRGDVMAIETATGRVRWAVDTDLPISGGVGLGAVQLYLGTSGGEVLALDRSDGQERWRTTVPSEVLTAPGYEADTVVVRTNAGHLLGLDAANGLRRWLYSYTVPALSLRGISPPLVSRGTVFAGLDNGQLVVLTLAEGRLLLEALVSPPEGSNELERLVDIDAPPVISDGVLYLVSYQGNAVAVDLNSGASLWNRDFSSYAGLDTDGQLVFVVDDQDHLWALEARSGGALWQQDVLAGRRLTRPVVAGDWVVVGDFDGYLHWFDPADGRLVGRSRVAGDGFAAAPLWNDGVLYTLGRDGDLTALRPAAR